jgi:hypothetical protein
MASSAYTMTDEDRTALLGWFGASRTSPFPLDEGFTLAVIFNPTLPEPWTLAWHTVGSPMGLGGDARAATLREAFEKLYAQM